MVPRLQGVPERGGAWGRWVLGGAGEPSSMYFGVEIFCLGCILTVRMHVDQGCGGFAPKVHSCSRGGLSLGWPHLLRSVVLV